MLSKISLLKQITGFLIFELVFTLITMPFLVFYGPFKNVRNMIVATAMTTFKHQYIATLFLSQETIQNIMESINQIESVNSNESLINFENKHDKTIELYNIHSKHFEGKVMLIHDPTRIEVGISRKFPYQGETTSEIAKNNGAIAAINAGGFKDAGMKGIGGIPEGIVIHNGKILYNEVGSTNAKIDLIGFTYYGKLLVGKYSLKDIKNMPIKEAVTFGPALVVNGEPMIKKGDGGWGIAPRTAIGQRKDGTVIFLTIDGRSLKSIGATLKDVQDIMISYGAYNAANLDGGSSTTMFYRGKVINNPSDALGERSVPTVFLVR